MSRMEDEEFRRRKMEEALEVKSLRRIISAYLNYPEAAEEDIRRYERYFRRLPPSHKALLLHLPLKFKKLRWCISQNSCFIFEMLKAFDPPLDMSQGIDISSEQFVDNVSDNNPFSGERIPFACQCESSSGQISSLKDDELRFGGSSNAVHGSPKAEPVCEEKKTEPSVESNPGNCSIGSAFDKKVENADGNNVKNGDNNPALSSVRASNARLSFYQIFLPTVKRVGISPCLGLHCNLS